MSSKPIGSTLDAKPTASVIAAYLNNNIDRIQSSNKLYSTKGKKSGKPPAIPSNITFKSLGKDTPASGITIDINDYEGLNSFKKTIQESPKLPIGDHVDMINDPIISYYLRLLNTYPGSKREEVIKKVVANFGIQEPAEFSMIDAISSASQFISNKDKLRVKIFNAVFPHDTHKSGENDLPQGVNIIYLQHMAKYHEKILEMYIMEKATEKEILESIVDLFIKDNVVSPEEAIQLRNPNIIASVITPPMVPNGKGNMTLDTKWINNLRKCKSFNPKTKNMSFTEDLIEETTAALIKSLVKEYGLARALIKQLDGTANAREVVEKVVDVGGAKFEKKLVARPVKVDLEECYTRFMSICEEFDEFNSSWTKDIGHCINEINNRREEFMKIQQDNEDLEDIDPEDVADDEEKRQLTIVFMTYFVNAARLIAEHLKSADPIKTLTKDTNIKFTQKLRDGIKKLVKAEIVDDEDIRTMADEFYSSWSPQNVSPSCDASKLEVYANIGKTCGIKLDVEYRIAVGIAIIQYMINEIRVITASNIGKSALKINIKV